MHFHKYLKLACRNSLADIQRQLDETKELYITMCHEKDQLEEKTTKSGDLLNANMVCN